MYILYIEYICIFFKYAVCVFLMCVYVCVYIYIYIYIYKMIIFFKVKYVYSMHRKYGI